MKADDGRHTERHPSGRDSQREDSLLEGGNLVDDRFVKKLEREGRF
jgi:hypothetical protein